MLDLLHQLCEIFRYIEVVVVFKDWSGMFLGTMCCFKSFAKIHSMTIHRVIHTILYSEYHVITALYAVIKRGMPLEAKLH